MLRILTLHQLFMLFLLLLLLLPALRLQQSLSPCRSTLLLHLRGHSSELLLSVNMCAHSV